jgi:hypothetical protein
MNHRYSHPDLTVMPQPTGQRYWILLMLGIGAILGLLVWMGHTP